APPHISTRHAFGERTPQLFRSEAFKALLQTVLGEATSVVASRRQARRFRPGLDYTLATPGAPGGGGEGGTGQQYMVLDAVLCFVDDREPYKEAAWRQDEVGGYVTYLGGDEDEDEPGGGEENGDGVLPPQDGHDGGSSSGARNGAAKPSSDADDTGAGGTGAQKNDAAVYKADEG
ncbi:unnamed protein product, partial [Hapterophycus canaliculatus]